MFDGSFDLVAEHLRVEAAKHADDDVCSAMLTDGVVAASAEHHGDHVGQKHEVER